MEINAKTQPKYINKPVKNTLKHRKYNNYFWAYLMILPSIAGLTIFFIIPFFQTFFYSFTDLGIFGQYTKLTTENYIHLFKDKEVWISLKNTLVFTILSVPIGIILSIIVATLLNSNIKGITVYRVLYFLPSVTMAAAVSMVWKWLLNSNYGLVNYLLSTVGIKGPMWLSSPKYAMYSIATVAVWKTVGYNMIIFLAGLQGISKSYYEASEIDGASSFQNFFYITMPLLTPTTFFVTVMSLISSFQVFDYIFMMVSKNSNIAFESVQSIVYLFYNKAFEVHEKGYGSAIAVLLFIIILGITMIQMKLQKKWVKYD